MEKFDWSALVFFLFFLFIVFVVILPALGRNRVKSSRKALIQRIEKARNPRVIVLIHRQESVSFLGMPISRYIDIKDSE